MLLEAPGRTGPAASAALAEATAEMIAGQADDIAFEKRRDVVVEQCTAMSRGQDRRPPGLRGFDRGDPRRCS